MAVQPNWTQFSPDQPNYLGAQGIGIPPWMQNQFGGGTSGGGAPASGSYGPNQGAASQGGTNPSTPTANSNVKPQWFQDFENRQNQQAFAASAPAPANPAQPPATTPTAPTGLVDASPYAPAKSGDVVTPPGPVAPQANTTGQGAPAASTTTTPYQPPPVTQPVGGSQTGIGVGSSPTAVGVTQPLGQSFNSAGQYAGTPVTNGWYNDSTGWHFGNQSAEDQFKSQYPGQVPGGTAPPATPAAPAATPPAPTAPSTPSSTPAPGAYTPAPDASTTPVALGGTQSTPDWVSNQQQLAAGFGSDVPAALGGTRAYARGGAVRGYAGGGRVDMDGHMGLVHAARQLSMQGEGPDKTLAHISPDESAMLDYLQGGRHTNQATGLPQYSLFGDILKAVARVAATTVGFMYGGPLGAAAGSAAATKLTGGSWKDAAISGGLSGLTAGIGNVAGGSSFLSSGNSLASGAAGGVNGMSDAAIAAGAPVGASGAAGSSIGQTLAQGVKYLGTAPGLGLAATSAMGAFNHPAGASTPPPGWQGPTTQLPSTYDPKNLPSWYAPNARKAADASAIDTTQPGAGILDPNDPNNASQMSQLYATPQGMADGGPVGMGASSQQLMSAADWGYVNAQGGGSIHGPGTGTSDSIPAMLSDGEAVIDRQTIDDAAKLAGKPGNNDAGQDVVEQFKQHIRRAAGRKNPRSPTSPMKAA